MFDKVFGNLSKQFEDSIKKYLATLESGMWTTEGQARELVGKIKGLREAIFKLEQMQKLLLTGRAEEPKKDFGHGNEEDS